MPIYEYSCSECGKRSTALLASYRQADPPCPACSSTKVQRLVSTFATARSADADDFGGAMGGMDEMGGMDGAGMDDGDMGDSGGWDGDDY